jgi:hypothetical protein
LEAIVLLAVIDADGADMDLDAVRAHLDYQRCQLTNENLAERIALLEITDAMLQHVVDGV